MRHRIGAFVLAFCAWPLQAQLYLVAGAPETNEYSASYGTNLLEVIAGQVKVVSEVFSQSTGTFEVQISQDWRKVVAVSGGSNDYAAVVDFDQAKVTKRCKIPKAAKDTVINEWIADVPGRGQALELWVAGAAGPAHDEVLSMDLRPSPPCEDSFKKVELMDLRYLVSDGFAGAGTAYQRGLPEEIDNGGALTATPRKIPLGIVISGEYRPVSKTVSKKSGAVIINNSRVVSVGLAGDHYQELVMRKTSKKWEPLPGCFGGRRFGSWIAWPESVSIPPGQDAGARKLESAGSSEWRDYEDGRGPNQQVRYENLAYKGSIFPGRLHLYNVDSQKSFAITTNQADSEVLLVANNTVYYRVTDRLYTAPLTVAGIGQSTLIARNCDIRDAHWAFIKR